MNRFEFAFVGIGNMGGALANAVRKSVCAKSMVLADADAEKARALAKTLDCTALAAEDAVKNARFVVLGVKPQVLPQLAQQLKPVLCEQPGVTLISMAAGTSIEQIRSLFGALPVIRIMPNTPVLLGKGVVQYATKDVSEENERAFAQAFSAVGVLDAVDEKLIDAGSAVFGCGPAFVYEFIQAMADGGVLCGLPRNKALLYAAQTVQGAAAMVLQSGKHPGELKDAVCSPGGTTIAGVRALEQGAFHAAAMDAVIAAYQKTLELGKK